MARRRWASGSVYRRHSDKRWVAAVRDRGKRRVVYGHSRPEVLEKMAELRLRIARGDPIPDGRITVGHQLVAWLAGKKGTVTPTSWVRYEQHVRLHLAPLATLPLHRLATEHVRALIRDMTETGKAPVTVRDTLRILRAALALAVDDGLLVRNVAKGVEPPSLPADRGARALAAPEVRRLLDASRDDPLGPLWALMVGTGLRMGEALALRWQDVNLDSGLLVVSGSLRNQPRSLRDGKRLVIADPKTAAGHRTVALPGFVALALAAHRRAAADLPRNVDGLVFTRADGQPMNQSTVQRAFATACRKAGLPRTRLHDLRHTAATLLLGSGASLDDVKRVMGHSSIAITSDVYGHRVEGRARELAATLNRALA
jgi:integrase